MQLISQGGSHFSQQCHGHRKGLAQEPSTSVIRNGLMLLCRPGERQCGQPQCFWPGPPRYLLTCSHLLSSSSGRLLSTDWPYHQHSFHGSASLTIKKWSFWVKPAPTACGQRCDLLCVFGPCLLVSNVLTQGRELRKCGLAASCSTATQHRMWPRETKPALPTTCNYSFNISMVQSNVRSLVVGART